MEYPVIKDVPAVTQKQMMFIDRVVMNEYNIRLMQMMENAGRSLALLAKHFFFDHQTDKNILVLAGTGGNGGGAITCARRLNNWGYDVTIVLTRNPNEYRNVPAHQLHICENLGIPVFSDIRPVKEEKYDLIIDGIIGYKLIGHPDGKPAEYIEYTNQSGYPVLSLDLPSGLHPDNGKIYDQTINATVTMALALPKLGQYTDSGRTCCGQLYLADISIPPEVYYAPPVKIKIDRLFTGSDIIKIL